MQNLKAQHIIFDSKDRLYGAARPILGLTGGIASGKTTATKHLISLGVPVIDADVLVKSIYSSKQAIEFITSKCPISINIYGKIEFKILRELFFNSPELQKDVENYIYTKIPEYFQEALNKLDFTKYSFLVYDAALLFEKSLHTEVDKTILITLPKEEQMIRLMKRDNITQALAKSIVSKQMPQAEKLKLASFVIDNGQDKESFINKLNQLLRTLID